MPRTSKWVIGDNSNKWQIGDDSNKWGIGKSQKKCDKKKKKRTYK